MTDDFDGDWREYMRGIENGNVVPTLEHLQAMCKIAREERETILAMLVKAAYQRDCFHVGGTPLKNAAGNTLFIDAARIDAVIDAIRCRASVSSPGEPK